MSDNEQTAVIIGQLFGIGVSSTIRMPAMLRLLRDQPDDVVWPVIADAWSACDNTWPYRSEILRLLRQLRSRPLVPAAATWPLKIYRGCSRPRARGVAWTTSRAVAERFALGHRGISVPEPVVASAVVEREAVFAMIDNRDEREVLVDPRRLRSLLVEDV